MKQLILVIFILVILLSACSTNSYNFVLYVSDQSFEISPVEITVYLDGQLIINEPFIVGNQHNWKKYEYQLTTGRHTIKAVSENGVASLEKEFLVLSDNWAVLDYWYYSNITGGAEQTPRHFSFHAQSTPIYFR